MILSLVYVMCMSDGNSFIVVLSGKYCLGIWLVISKTYQSDKEKLSMPFKDGSLTRGEKAFIDSYSEHGDRKKAEKAAGFRPGSGYAVLARPEIQKQIVQHQTARLTSDALPAAVETLIEIMQNKKAPAAARVQASKVVLDRALPVDGSGKLKELHEMTPEEIAQSIATLEQKASAMAKDVTPDPSPEKGGIFE